MSKQPLTDEEGEVRELTAADFAEMRPAAEIVPEVVVAYTRYINKALVEYVVTHPQEG